MPISFNENSGSGSFIRLNLQTGQWTFKGPNTDAVPFDATQGILFDLQSLQMGWLSLNHGRDWQPWPALGQRTPQPTEDHKTGFSIDCFVPNLGHANFSDSSQGKCNFIAKLYNEAEQTPQFAAQQKPFVVVTGCNPVSIGNGMSADVSYSIAGWQPEMPAAQPQPVQPVSQPAPAPMPPQMPAQGFAAPPMQPMQPMQQMQQPAAPQAPMPSAANNFGFTQ